jgi:hypothetical protein
MIMRLIDADALDFTFDRRCFSAGDEQYVRGVDDAIGVINNAPTVDAVSVVRCRECESYDENGDCISLDLLIGIHSDTINYDFCPDPDFYCAYGRRKIETVLPKSDAKNESLEADQ